MNTQLISYNTFNNRTEFEMKEGSRPWDMILLISDGVFSCNINGMEFTIHENEAAYFPPNVMFKRSIVKPISFHQFSFYGDSDSVYYSHLIPGLLDIDREHVRVILDNLNTISRLSLVEDKDLFCHEIDHIITENYITCANKKMRSYRKDKDVTFVIRYMSEHIGDKICISALAEERHLTHAGLIWKFKRYTGYTPSAFLKLLRLQNGKQLLLEGKLRINEIARICGFTDAYYFSNSFRRYFKVSPSKYRELAAESIKTTGL